ncbi:MAG: hypothetical protein PGN08_08725 [Sphingomonas taxi]
MWTIAAIVAILYCLAKAIIDLRARRYAWGIAGLFSAAVLLLTPLPTRAIKVDLPIAGQ